jgi:hypothetical protein
MNPTPLAAALGVALRAFRTAQGLRQDDVARAARQVGLTWTRSVVVALEAGRRYLTIDEFAHLPRMLELLGVPPGRADALLKSHARLAELELVPVLPRKALGISVVVPAAMVEAFRAEDRVTVDAAYRAAGGDLEQKVARRYGLTPMVVALIAQKTWGRSITEERDRRVTDQAAPGTGARALQALRAHATRALLQDLAPRLTEARHRLRERRRTRR